MASSTSCVPAVDGAAVSGQERNAAQNRRQMLGGLGMSLLGLGLPDWFRLHAQPTPRRSARAKSCIYIFLNGGASHIDIWDMKPQAPAEIRGEFQPIATSAPGIRITEHLPLTAGLAHQLALVRSVEMPGVANTHMWGFYYMFTGHPPEPARVQQQGPTSYPLAGDWPFLGSVVAAKVPPPRNLPPAVQLPFVWDEASEGHAWGGNFAGRLGRTFDPVMVRYDPRTTPRGDSGTLFQSQAPLAPWEALVVPDLTLPGEVASERLFARRTLLDRLDHLQRRQETTANGWDEHQERAFSLLTSPATKRALALDQEPDRLRNRYGRSINGQSLLMARRLVEAGVPFVTLQWFPPREYYYNWDCHEDNFRALKNYLLPVFDRALSALLTDLDERGLLDETLVLIGSDMGREPRIGDLTPTGRRHWNLCQTAVMAGGGVRGGQVYGASDRIAAYPIDQPIRPEHLAATVYSALGIADDLFARDAQGRPYHLLEEGHPLPLFG